jgi:hypothetical protein
MSEISILDAVKIQANALVPVVKKLEAEIGKERAHSVVGQAIAESYAKFRASRSKERNTHPGDADGALDFPVESKIIEHTDSSYGFDVTGCAFADYFRKIGEPEIGALLTCGVDFAVERKLRPDWEFQRTQTRMQGAPHCDFRWRRKRA